MGSGADTDRSRGSTLIAARSGKRQGKAESTTRAPVAQLVRAAAF